MKNTPRATKRERTTTTPVTRDETAARQKNETSGAPLTPEEAANIARSWAMPFFNNDELIGELLLLLRNFTYSESREDLLCAVESAMMPFTVAASEATGALVSSTLSQYRGA